jgi:hypothetical protein
MLRNPGHQLGMSIAPRSIKHLTPAPDITTGSMATGTSVNDQTIH